MKIDLVEINKLSPPGLWDLTAISAVMAMLHNVLNSRLGGHVSALLYMRMIAWHAKRLRERTRDNLNMRIKAWVMLCPVRIARVRNIIGERAIRRWHKNRLADYALTKYFGDWRRKWPDGFGGGLSGDMRSRRQAAPIFNGQPRAYNWKLFALVKIVNVERFLYGQARKTPNCNDIQTAFQKLWGMGIQGDVNAPQWSQPRQRRVLKPVEFTPYDLTPKPATDTPQESEQPVDKIQNTDVKKLHAPPKNEREDTEKIIKAKKKKPP